MPSSTNETTVKGGKIIRDADTGDLVAIETDEGITKVSEESRMAVKGASKRRAAALQRLADR